MPNIQNNANKSVKNQELKIIKDARFSNLHHDPRFLRMSKKRQKVVVDERFKEMLTDDNSFGTVCK